MECFSSIYVCCLGHIINLAVNVFLFIDVEDWEKKKEEEVVLIFGPFQKLHDIVVYIRGCEMADTVEQYHEVNRIV